MRTRPLMSQSLGYAFFCIRAVIVQQMKCGYPFTPCYTPVHEALSKTSLVWLTNMWNLQIPQPDLVAWYQHEIAASSTVISQGNSPENTCEGECIKKNYYSVEQLANLGHLEGSWMLTSLTKYQDRIYIFHSDWSKHPSHLDFNTDLCVLKTSPDCPDPRLLFCDPSTLLHCLF